MKSRSPGASLSGHISKRIDLSEPKDWSNSASFLPNSVADGMAIDLYPADKRLQQSLQPSAMKSVSPGRRRFNTYRQGEGGSIPADYRCGTRSLAGIGIGARQNAQDFDFECRSTCPVGHSTVSATRARPACRATTSAGTNAPLLGPVAAPRRGIAAPPRSAKAARNTANSDWRQRAWEAFLLSADTLSGSRCAHPPANDRHRGSPYEDIASPGRLVRQRHRIQNIGTCSCSP